MIAFLALLALAAPPTTADVREPSKGGTTVVAIASEPAKGAGGTTTSNASANLAANADKLRDRAIAGDCVAWDVLESLTTEVGPRPAGSPAMTRAKDWALAKLKKLGFKNVHAEEFKKKNAWQRGAEAASMTAPYPMSLAVLALGNSAPTPEGGIEADVTVFRTLEELTAAPIGSLKGRIAVVNQPMTRTQSGEGYGAAVRVRGAGPSLAAARGAVAFLMRSVATGAGRAPHTGATRYDDAFPRIPAAAIGVADADLIMHLAARGPVRVSLSLASTVVAEAPAWNVVGELPGREAETVVIGGHLDSWDRGQGAIDDGAGVAITVAAARLLADMPRMKRTVRVVLFGSEETGGSGTAYAAAHKDEVAHMALASESDLGPGPVYRLALPKGAVEDPQLHGLTTSLVPIGVFVSDDPPRYGGSDVEGLEEAGVPIAELDADATHYFDVHHSADDTLDKVSRADLQQSVAAWAVLLTYVADSNVDLRRKPDAPAPAPR